MVCGCVCGCVRHLVSIFVMLVSSVVALWPVVVSAAHPVSMVVLCLCSTICGSVCGCGVVIYGQGRTTIPTDPSCVTTH